MTERELLVDCLRRLNRLGLQYMLTGSMASNFWGMPRTTHDLDFVVAFESGRSSEIAAAFDDEFFLDEASAAQAVLESHHAVGAATWRRGGHRRGPGN